MLQTVSGLCSEMLPLLKQIQPHLIISVLYIYVSLSIDLYIILMHIYIYISCTSCTQGNELPQSHYSDNWEGTLVS